MIFATEQVTSSLTQAILDSDSTSRSRRGSTTDASMELDEIEIQKGLLQIGKALQFLHESAKLVHSNLTPDAIIVNAKVCIDHMSLLQQKAKPPILRETGNCQASACVHTLPLPPVKRDDGSSHNMIDRYLTRHRKTLTTLHRSTRSMRCLRRPTTCMPSAALYRRE
jgi:hypothetical protein